MASSLVLLCALSTLAQLPSAPSDDPAPAEGTLPAVSPTKPKEQQQSRGSQGFVEARGSTGQSHFRGFDLGFTTFFSSGVYGAAESYTGSLSIWLEPSYALGQRWFKGSWWEPLMVTVRFPIELELVGTDPRFRGAGFSSSPLLNGVPEGQALEAPQAGLVDGARRVPVILGDTWLSLIHGNLGTIPLVDVTVVSGLRVALPTSAGSRNTGLISTVSWGFIFDKGLGPLHLTYVFRPAKYFFSRAVPEQTGANAQVEVNGRFEDTWRPSSTGVPNPDFGFINGLSASLTLPKGFSVSASYFLFNTRPFPLNGCSVPGVALANPCLDGAAVTGGTGSQWRNDHWFLASVDWSTGPVSLSLGLSTYRPINQLDGRVSQPFFVANRSNATTLYLSFSTSAEQLTSAFTEETP